MLLRSSVGCSCSSGCHIAPALRQFGRPALLRCDRYVPFTATQASIHAQKSVKCAGRTRLPVSLERSVSHSRLCRPPAASRGRPRKSDAALTTDDDDDDDDDDEDEDLSVDNDEDFDPEGGNDKEEEDKDDGEVMPVEHWAQLINDWYTFQDSNPDDPYQGMVPLKDEGAVPWKDTAGRDKLMWREMDKLREMPGYVGFMHLRKGKPLEINAEPMVGEAPLPLNPDWDDWGFRAYAETEEWKRRRRAEWNARRLAVGQYTNLLVDAATDNRLQMPWDEQEKEWTNEEIYNFITQNGTAAHPAEVEVRVDDPDGHSDVLDFGAQYIESTEEFLFRTGHMMPRTPTQEDLTDLGITQLAQDFEDFEDSNDDESDESDAAEARVGPIMRRMQDDDEDWSGIASEEGVL